MPDVLPTHDQLQALVAAMAGKAIVEGQSDAYAGYGVPPFKKDETVLDGFIFTPVASMIRVFQYGSNTLSARPCDNGDSFDGGQGMTKGKNSQGMERNKHQAEIVFP